MAFEEKHVAWMELVVSGADGGRLRRLQEGQGHGEKAFLQAVWFPAFGGFEGLHPEYEVRDFKDGSRFIDFAYIRGAFRAAIEIDGFGPHWKDITQEQFADQWMRQNDLIIDGWKVLRFAYVDVTQRPRRCQQVLHQLLGRWLGEYDAAPALTPEEKEIVRVALGSVCPVTPRMVADRLDVCTKHAAKLLRGLVEKRILSPVGKGTQRVRRYRVENVNTF